MNSSTSTIAAHRSTTNVSATHADGRAVIGINQVANICVLIRGQHAALKVKRTATDVDEPHRRVSSGAHDGAIDGNLVLEKGLGSSSVTRSRISHVVSELTGRCAVVIELSKVAVFVAILLELVISRLLQILNRERRTLGHIEHGHVGRLARLHARVFDLMAVEVDGGFTLAKRNVACILNIEIQAIFAGLFIILKVVR